MNIKHGNTAAVFSWGLVVVCFTVFLGGCGKKEKPVQNRTLYADGDLQVAVENAWRGDTLIIRPGTYRENLWIGKDITLMGESKDSVILIPSRNKNFAGIQIYGKAEVTLKNIRVECAKAVGDVVDYGLMPDQGSQVKMSDCYVSGANCYGCLIRDSKAEIVNGFFEGNKISGAAVLNSQVKFENCMIFGNSKAGIECWTGETTLEEVESRNQIDISGCFFRAGEYGILLKGKSGGSVKNCTVSSTGNDGIHGYNYEGSFDIEGNTVKNSRNGICLGGKDNPQTPTTVNGNTVSGSTVGVSIYGKDSVVKITDNDCGENNFGVQVYLAKKADVFRNSVLKSLETGIVITEPGGDVSVRENLCSQNALQGIFVYNPHAAGIVEVVDNKCFENGRNGIWIETGKVSLEGNECCKNLYNGICIYHHVSGPIVRNTCNENKYVGIRAESTINDVRLSQNILNGNGYSAVYGFPEQADKTAN